MTDNDVPLPIEEDKPAGLYSLYILSRNQLTAGTCIGVFNDLETARKHAIARIRAETDPRFHFEIFKFELGRRGEIPKNLGSFWKKNSLNFRELPEIEIGAIFEGTIETRTAEKLVMSFKEITGPIEP